MSIADIEFSPGLSNFDAGAIALPASSNDSISFSQWENSFKIMALKTASLFTEPICKVREYAYTFYILDQTCSTLVQKIVKIAALTLGIALFAFAAPWTAPIGIAIRGLVGYFESKPFVYLAKDSPGKTLAQDRQITLVSHNECYTSAGFSITDGHATPPSDRDRINANIRKIKELDPDIICLQEVSDVYDACYLSSQLSEYPFVIPVAGVRAVGPSSMLYIASKYEIVENSIEFVPFIKGTELTGRARFSEKGFLSFDVKSRGADAPFATIVATHLQHSEIPAEPEKSDEIARAAQMNKIIKHIQKKKASGLSVVFTGDLNQEEKELNAFLASNQIDWLRKDPSIQGQFTWGGDTWCAELMKKTPSGPLVLDYTFVTGDKGMISTQIFDTGYSGLEFRKEALSDHNLLFSTITVD